MLDEENENEKQRQYDEVTCLAVLVAEFYLAVYLVSKMDKC